MTRDEVMVEVKRLLQDAAMVGDLKAEFVTSNPGVSYCAGLMVGMAARAKALLKEMEKMEQVVEDTY